MILAGVRRMVEPIHRRVLLLLARGVLKAIDDAPKLQVGQMSLMAGEIRDRIERFQEYGFSSVPLPGAEAVAGFLGGNRDHGIIIATDDRRYRVHLQPGEVALYNSVSGTTVTLLADGVVKVASATRIELSAPLVKVTGDLEVDGDISDHHAAGDGNTMEDIRNTYNSHGHPGGPPPDPQMP